MYIGLSPYLLFALGLHGGLELSHASFGEMVNPACSLTLALVISFPFNILACIPIYFRLANTVAGRAQGRYSGFANRTPWRA